MKYILRFTGYLGLAVLFYSFISDIKWEMPALGVGIGFLLISVTMAEILLRSMND